MCRCLLAYHALSGCDTTSCFKGKGKTKALNILQNNSDSLQPLSKLGDTFPPTGEVIDCCEKYICQLYEPNGEESDINLLRFRLFCSKGLENDKLPPCKDSLMMHIKRANYQCALWKQATEKYPCIPSPTENGWVKESNGLKPVFMTQEAVPKHLVELTVCHCKTSKCAMKKCRCVKNNLKCTSSCSCRKSVCQNVDQDSSDESEESGTDESDY